jgi:hypothetical protein
VADDYGIFLLDLAQQTARIIAGTEETYGAPPACGCPSDLLT